MIPNPFSKKQTLKRKLRNRPYIKVFSLSNIVELKTICDQLLNNEIYVDDQFPVVKLEKDRIWTSDPLQDRRWQFRLHSFISVELLVSGYERLGEKRYLNKAVELTQDWAKHHFPRSDSPMAWHDHSTALRLIVISKLFELWRQTEWDDRFFETVCDLVTEHARKLCDPDFYMDNHNHGLDQDMALYVAAVVFEFLPEADQWRELALRRFWKQMGHLFAGDGSYREHSPQYTLIFVERLLKFAYFLKDRDGPHFERLIHCIKQQMRYLTYILQPDGQLPGLGDTVMQPAERTLYNPPENEFAALQYVISKGQAGKPPQELDALFPAGGYAVFRNKWPYDQDTMQVVFYSSFHSRVHKHCDDLALTVFGHGQPLLIDGGQYKYDYDSAERKYVVSTRAHNTVTVDGQNTETVRLNIGKSGLTDYYAGEPFAFAAGAHCLYPGVVHRRMVLMLKPYETIVLDWLKGYKEHHFEQHFTFYPNLDCKLSDKAVLAAMDGKQGISLQPLMNQEEVQVKLARGETDPLRGWCSVEYGKLEPAWTAGYTLTGREARFATHINIQPERQKLTDFRWEQDRITIRWTDRDNQQQEVVIMVGLRHIFLAMDGLVLDVQHIDQPALWAAMEEAASYEYREKYRAERQRRLRWQEEAEKLKRQGNTGD
ncbi:hypothetical protein GCM10010965_22300 [Caldalkalibacillus thermarum]|uniref:heparinase II/III family protein n=1 Tax=Caldalkalibacillus thermarum TaxID=296745 RepID=UPI00166B482F|nr:alginate lyase family protein [Caldalkalibacillus thermarum]GGK28997.1 hypothetical protein GCM10010965_22300 [Caldalkalibacillus thermarum]